MNQNKPLFTKKRPKSLTSVHFSYNTSSPTNEPILSTMNPSNVKMVASIHKESDHRRATSQSYHYINPIRGAKIQNNNNSPPNLQYSPNK